MNILFCESHVGSALNFRKKLILQLIKNGHKVYLSCPNNEGVDFFKDNGCIFLETPMKRNAISIISDIILIKKYKGYITEYEIDVIFSYTIKPIVYSGIAVSKIKNKPKLISTITGLGNGFNNKNGMFSKVLLIFYKKGLSSASHVFFQNKGNMNYFLDNKIVSANKAQLVNGSGVDLSIFEQKDFITDGRIKFLYSARMQKSKGTGELLEAIRVIKNQYSNVTFDLIGYAKGAYADIINEMQKEGLLIYHGYVNNSLSFYEKCDCLIFPSFYNEGIPNVLLECSAVGRMFITTNDIDGCKDVLIDGYNGIGFKSKNTKALIEAIKKVINMSMDEIHKMGNDAAKEIISNYSRENIVNEYIKLL